jgi:DNA-binding CsgD family transcriptional regulator
MISNTPATMYDSVAALTNKMNAIIDKESNDATSFMPQIDSSASVIILLYNHSTLKYEFVGPSIKSVTGYDSKEFMDGGLQFAMSLVDMEHNRLYNKHIIPLIFRYYLRFAIKRKVLDLQFSYTFKLKKKDGDYMWAYHHMNVLKTNKWGFPMYTMVFISDITAIKKDENIDFIIALKDNEQALYKPIYSRNYHGLKTNFKFSSRELEVLSLLGKGHTTKEIADKLNLSTHTVTSHRKNMMEKAGVKNASELIQLAISKSLI